MIFIEEPKPGPLQTRFLEAQDAMYAAKDAWGEDDSTDADDRTAPSWLAFTAASQAADQAFQAYLASDEPRLFYYQEEDCAEVYFWATSHEEAKQYVAEQLSEGAYDFDLTETTWVSAYLYPLEGARERVQVALHPEEPECTRQDHDWQSPQELVGGIKENPGVWGHGGGVIAHEVCMNCGCGKTTDTWAQNPVTGEQGLTSISYEPGKFLEDLPEPLN